MKLQLASPTRDFQISAPDLYSEIFLKREETDARNAKLTSDICCRGIMGKTTS